MSAPGAPFGLFVTWAGKAPSQASYPEERGAVLKKKATTATGKTSD